MTDIIAEQGLVQVMRTLLSSPEPLDEGWTGTYLEIARRGRTDPQFRDRRRAHAAALTAATKQRLQRQATAGTLRDDVPVEVLARYLELVLEGLVSHLAMGMPADDLGGVLDLVEAAVRR